MNKNHMLRKNKDFSYCYRRGKKCTTPYFHMYWVAAKYNVRAGFSVSKKVGNSVKRNKVRRRMKEAFTLLLPGIGKSCSIIFVARPACQGVPFQKLHEVMRTAVQKNGL